VLTDTQHETLADTQHETLVSLLTANFSSQKRSRDDVTQFIPFPPLPEPTSYVEACQRVIDHLAPMRFIRPLVDPGFGEARRLLRNWVF
jgi:hypothetical protein